MFLEEGGVLGVVLLGREQMTYLKEERFVWGPEGKEKLNRSTTKGTSSKTAFKDFPNTLRALPTDCF